MKTHQSGEIDCRIPITKNDTWNTRTRTITADRKQYSSTVKLTVPIGPRTKETISVLVDEEEFIRLAMWMRGEAR